MADGPRLTLQAVEQFEELMDTWKEVASDGEITAEEGAMYDRLKEDLYQMLMYIDTSFGLAVTMIRRGHEAPSVQRRMAEHGLRVIKGGGKPHGPQAA